MYMFLNIALSGLFRLKLQMIENLTNKNYDIEPILLLNAINNDNMILKKKAIILMFEFSCGYFLKQPQLDLINEIIKNKETNENNIYQLIMGGGKTSVIGPLVSIICSIKNIQTINLLPEFLVEQSFNIFCKNVNLLFNFNVCKILSGGNKNILETSEIKMAKNLAPNLTEKQNRECIYIISDGSIKSLLLNSQKSYFTNKNNENNKNKLTKLNNLSEFLKKSFKLMI